MSCFTPLLVKTAGVKSNMPRKMEVVLEDPITKLDFEAKDLWHDYFKSLYELYKDGVLCDVTLKVGKKSIKCHRVILACCCPYFRIMFTTEMAESRMQTIVIKDIDETALELLINFAYTSKITLTIENVQQLLYASSILQLELVAQACCDFMKTHLHPANCLGIRTVAERHGLTDLMKTANKFTYDCFQKIIECDEFLEISSSHLIELVSSPDLYVDSEIRVYEAVMKWVQYNTAERKVYLPRLLSKLKLPLLPPTYLMEFVEKEELLKRNLECRDYLDEAKYYQLSLASIIPGIKGIYTERTRPRKSCAGVVFCVGGRGAAGDPFASIECFDIRNNRWFQITEMSTRRRHVGVASANGKVYAIGGHNGNDHLASAEVFDPQTNKWKLLAPMAKPRRGIAIGHLNGPLYAVGGLDDNQCFADVERYDTDSNSWSLVCQMNIPRGGVGIGALKGFMYAIGGNDGATTLDSCERYDPHLNKWIPIASMNRQRAGTGIAILNGYIYAIGGFDENSPLETVERYNPDINQWEMVSNMSTKRGGVGVATLAGKILAIGGHDGANYLNSVEAYDVDTNKWEPSISISVCRAGAGVTWCNSSVDQLVDIGSVNVVSCV